MSKSGGDDFLGRWSRRKLGGASDEPVPEAPEPEIAKSTVTEADSEDQGDPEVIAQLPDIDSMDDSSDFTIFLQAGVPEAMRRRALRKLWRVNPVLANLDGLNDYDEDYTQLHTVGRSVKTLFKIGKGFVEDDSEASAAAAPPKTAEPVPESPAADEPETPVAAVPPAAEHTPEPAKPDTAPRNTARRRRWGAPDTQT
jgi:cell division septation protein DedD